MTMLPMFLGSATPRRTGAASRYFLGIDLGTTNSTAVVVDSVALLKGDARGAIQPIPVRQDTERGGGDSPLVPSMVAEVVPGRWVVGAGAREARTRGLIRGRRIFYSTKSEMGIGREPAYPFAATPDLDSPYKVAARVLSTLRDAVEGEFGASASEQLAVSVPASFQLTARRDTARAASLAGMELSEQGLIDEPNAALLDYLLTVEASAEMATLLDPASPKCVLVFDFGGGTCDVSVVRIHADRKKNRVLLANLAISRFERLGGDNIDLKIAEDLLLPRLLEENGLGRFDLAWVDRKNFALPGLINCAEALKLGICVEYSTQLGLRSDSAIDRSRVVARQPSVRVQLPVRDETGKASLRSCVLENPAITLDEFEALLSDFLSEEFLHPRGSDLNPITSVLSPIRDALDRGNLKPSDIDAVLFVGGSSLIPQVRHAVERFLPEAVSLRFPSDERTMMAVARGAALQSFFVNGCGIPLIKPIAQESIGVLTSGGGFAELLKAGTELPYPSNGSYERYPARLLVPHENAARVEIVLATSAKASNVLGVEAIALKPPVFANDEIMIEWRLDANKVLEVRAARVSQPGSACEITLENPLCATAHETENKRKILRLEQEVAAATARKDPRSESAEAMAELAQLCFDEKQQERAIDWARSAQQALGAPSVDLSNLMGNAYAQLGALERAERCYLEAARVAPDSSTIQFNLSLLYERQDEVAKAIDAVSRAIAMSPESGAYRAQRASLLRRSGDADAARLEYEEAARLMDERGARTKWERSWRESIAVALGDTATAARMRQANEKKAGGASYDTRSLPRQVGGLARSGHEDE